MKLKKLFAGVVAAAMIATMSFPAFATMGGSATVNNEGTARSDTASIVLKKEYNVLNPGTTSPAETFTFSHEKHLLRMLARVSQRIICRILRLVM